MDCDHGKWITRKYAARARKSERAAAEERKLDKGRREESERGAEGRGGERKERTRKGPARSKEIFEYDCIAASKSYRPQTSSALHKKCICRMSVEGMTGPSPWLEGEQGARRKGYE